MDSANNWVKVKFFRQKRVYFGEAVYVAGSIPALGDWNPYKAFKLNWSEGDNWQNEIYIQAPCDFEFKYFTSSIDQGAMSSICWEAGSNAKMSVFPRELPVLSCMSMLVLIRQAVATCSNIISSVASRRQ